MRSHYGVLIFLIVTFTISLIGIGLTKVQIVTHSRLTKSTALRFAPRWHAYIDRLEAILNNQVPPDWARRFAEVKELYPSQLVQ